MIGNPYESPASLDISPAAQSTGPYWFVPAMAITAVALSLPPLPLFFWVADGEPFVGPPQSADVFKVAISGAVAFAWVIWSAALCFGVWRYWLLPRNLAWITLPLLAGGISVVVVFLYGFDQGWFQ